ncbi:MAG: NAD(P)H-dependent oxidoreductase [Proteobacteria bacterium]|nr:NAD(P)H-dependent oxidoreductase [Pseudomonadota bacterium]
MSIGEVQILAISGSTREESLNTSLLRAASEGIRGAGGTVTFADLRDLAMPMYDADLQRDKGFPESVREFRRMVAAGDGFLIATPEYNHGPSAVLKNALDWASRRDADGVTGALFRGKPAAMFSAAPGVYGGVRALIQLRENLSALGLFVMPGQMALVRAKHAFDEDGLLNDAVLQAEAESQALRVAQMVLSLRPRD